MTKSESIEQFKERLAISDYKEQISKYYKAMEIAINALEKQEKIEEIIANANQWSKEDVVVKAQAFCDIEKILKESD